MVRLDSRSKRKYLRCAAIVLAVVFCLSAALLAISLWEKNQNDFADEYSGGGNSTLQYNGEDYIARDDVEALLLIGLDKFQVTSDNTAYNNDKSADFLLLLVFDNTNKTCEGIHINRDTIAKMNMLGVAGDKIGTVEQQIALAHTYGNGKEVSCRNTVDSVSDLLFGIKIKHYVSITMEAVPIYNDFVGGVKVTVLDDFSGIDDTLIKDTEVTLRGEHALNYVRNRYGMQDSTNLNRMKRQRQYLEGLYTQTQTASKNNDNFTLETVAKLSEYVVSDCTVNQMQSIFEKFSNYELVGISELQGESVVGEKYMEFHIDEQAALKTVIESFYKKED